MILVTLGSINKRIHLGYNKRTKQTFIYSSSNCIEMSNDEMSALITILPLINAEDTSMMHLSKYVPLWEPAPPLAEEKIV